LTPATFIDRPNRFVARVRLEGGTERRVHVASSGRMTGLLVPGAPVWIREGPARPGGKTQGVLALVATPQSWDPATGLRPDPVWVSVDTSLPGRLLREGIVAGSLAPFTGYDTVRPEFPYGESRMDFLLTGPDRPPCLVEVKSVTEVVVDPDGVRVGRFPDAPTQRGARHLRELMRARAEGYRSVVCLIIQRCDAAAVGPHDAIDPHFGATLREAVAAGVEVYSWICRVTPSAISLDRPVPLRM
jgi:sugar fermentation stimulation protein A